MDKTRTHVSPLNKKTGLLANKKGWGAKQRVGVLKKRCGANKKGWGAIKKGWGAKWHGCQMSWLELKIKVSGVLKNGWLIKLFRGAFK